MYHVLTHLGQLHLGGIAFLHLAQQSASVRERGSEAKGAAGRDRGCLLAWHERTTRRTARMSPKDTCKDPRPRSRPRRFSFITQEMLAGYDDSTLLPETPWARTALVPCCSWYTCTATLQLACFMPRHISTNHNPPI